MQVVAAVEAQDLSQATEAKTWTRDEIIALFELPFMDLVHKAGEVHRANHDPNEIQLSSLLSIKTGGCAENCNYCSQSAHHKAEVEAEKLMNKEQVFFNAEIAKANGADRFCMGAAWRELKDRDVEKIVEIVQGVKAMGMETCMTLGMVTKDQAKILADAGLDYYNHNLDTSPEYYDQVVTTRTYEDRLDTLSNVRDAGMKVCTGGIIGMGETREDRASLLEVLANLQPQPDSVPINMLVPVPGTPFEKLENTIDTFEWIRSIAVARILLPKARVRLSAGRSEISDEAQALAFYCGANSIFYGDRLLTTDNPEANHDKELVEKLGMHPKGQACH